MPLGSRASRNGAPRARRRSGARRGRARRLPPGERRGQLLACALAVVARRGLGASHHAEVAAEAEVAVPTVFAYFPTRDALVAAVLDEVRRFYTDLAERVHAPRLPASEALLAHARAFAASVDEHPDHARVWLAWSSAVRGELWPRYRVFERRVVAVIARTLGRGQREGTISREIHPEDGARIAIGAAYLIAQMKLSGRPEPEVARFLAALTRALSAGA
jgi:TetR/AcrR family hemagglutinin/protease transcriptional regulator